MLPGETHWPGGLPLTTEGNPALSLCVTKASFHPLCKSCLPWPSQTIKWLDTLTPGGRSCYVLYCPPWGGTPPLEVETGIMGLSSTILILNILFFLCPNILKKIFLVTYNFLTPYDWATEHRKQKIFDLCSISTRHDNLVEIFLHNVL